jgi:hypothetical protein
MDHGEKSMTIAEIILLKPEEGNSVPRALVFVLDRLK